MKSVYKAICLRKHVMENIRAPKIFRKKQILESFICWCKNNQCLHYFHFCKAVTDRLMLFCSFLLIIYMSVPTFRWRHHPNVETFTYHVRKKSNSQSSNKEIFKNSAVIVLSVLLSKVKNSIKKRTACLWNKLRKNDNLYTNSISVREF